MCSWADLVDPPMTAGRVPALLGRIRRRMRPGQTLIVFMDYDGTLIPIAGRPQDAIPGAALLDLLRDLERTPRLVPVIVTGRPIRAIRKLVPLRRTWFVGTHGVDLSYGQGRILKLVRSRAAESAIRRLVPRLRACIDSTFTLENKRVSISLHFRLARRAKSRDARRAFQILIRPYAEKKILACIRSKGAIEARPWRAHKGLAVPAVLWRIGSPDAFCIALGDDKTDEDLFRAVRAREGIPIAIGRRARGARWRLARPADALSVLRGLAAPGFGDRRRALSGFGFGDAHTVERAVHKKHRD